MSRDMIAKLFMENDMEAKNLEVKVTISYEWMIWIWIKSLFVKPKEKINWAHKNGA